jgi:hypothetical protein
MNLKDVIQRAEQRRTWDSHKGLLLNTTAQAVATDLANRFDDRGQMPSREELGALLQRFSASHAGGSLKEFTRRQWGRAIWGIWDQSCPLSSLKGFWPHFQIFLQKSNRRSYVKNLILTYLREFDPKTPGIEHAARLIREFIAREDNRDWLWTRRHESLHLFDPSAAPQALAKFLLGFEREIAQALIDAGCQGVAETGGMERAAFVEALNTLRQQLESGPNAMALLNRVLAWSTKGDRLRFEMLRIPLAEALLSPWHTAPATADLEKTILRFMLKHFGDLRLTKKAWLGTSEPSQRVIRRWLTKASLDQFIEVVTKVAEGSHWKYRKAFWMGYFDRGHIEEAWVLFGYDARRIVHRAAEEIKGFGTIHGGQSNHCVLMLKIGGLTIADWSHNGSCRIWLENNKHRPDLYLNYRADELRMNADFEQPHRGSEQHNWQGSVARFIQEQTGAWVHMRDRMPRE